MRQAEDLRLQQAHVGGVDARHRLKAKADAEGCRRRHRNWLKAKSAGIYEGADTYAGC